MPFRRVAGLAAALVLVIPNIVLAQPNEQASRRAYVFATRCFAASAGVISDPHSTPQEVATAREQSRRAFDAAVRMGRVLGLSNQVVNDDIHARSRAEAALMVHDNAYFRQARTECGQLGF